MNSSSEAGLVMSQHYMDNSLELDQLFSPKIDTKHIFTTGMDSGLNFNHANAEEIKTDDAPIINDTANVEVDDDVWSLLLDLEAEDRKEVTTTDNSNMKDNSSAIYNTMFDSLLGDVDINIDDIDQLFKLPAELETLDDELLTSSGTSTGSSETVANISTADMLANVISQTGLFTTFQPCIDAIPSDTTLSFNELLDLGLVSEELPEQVVPVDVIVKSEIESEATPEVSSPVVSSSRKRKSTKDSSQPASKIAKTDQAPSTSSSSTSAEEKYTMMRIKNNEASKRSRKLRKEKQQQYGEDLVELEEKNARLKAEAERLEKAVNELKAAITLVMSKSSP